MLGYPKVSGVSADQQQLQMAHGAGLCMDAHDEGYLYVKAATGLRRRRASFSRNTRGSTSTGAHCILTPLKGLSFTLMWKSSKRDWHDMHFLVEMCRDQAAERLAAFARL